MSADFLSSSALIFCRAASFSRYEVEEEFGGGSPAEVVKADLLCLVREELEAVGVEEDLRGFIPFMVAAGRIFRVPWLAEEGEGSVA